MKPLLSLTFCFALVSGCVSVPSDYRVAAIHDELSKRVGAPIPTVIEPDVRRSESQRLADEVLGSSSAVAIAFLNHPEVFAALAQYGIRQSEYLELVTIPNPLLSWESLTPGGKPIVEAELSAHFKAILWAPKLRSLGKKQLSAQVDLLALRMLALRRKVLSAYYQHIANRQRLELYQQVVGASRSRTELAERLRAAGNITARQLDQERDLLLQSETQLAMARQAVDKSNRELTFALGNPAAEWRVPIRLPKLPARARPVTQMESLVLLSIDKQTAALRQRLGLERTSIGIDTLEVGFTGEREDSDWEFGPLIEVQMPLFHQGQARQLGAEQQLLALEYERLLVRNNIDQAFAQAQSNLDFARQMIIQHLDVVLPLRAELYELAVADYNAMQIGFFDLVFARQQQIQAGLSFIDQLHNYWQADADLSHLQSGGAPEHLKGGTTMSGSRVNASSQTDNAH